MARYAVIFDNAAEAEADHAYQRYAERNRAVAHRFRVQLDEAVERIADEAHTFPFDEDGVQRCRLPKPFPFALLFEIHDDVVFVVAVMHLKRKPGYWK